MSYRTIAVVVLVMLAGCGGGDDREEPLVVKASPADVSDDALSAISYEVVKRSNRTRNTTVTLQIQGDVQVQPTFRVRATTHRSAYERAVDSVVAAFGVLVVPAVKPSDALANPVDPFRGRGVSATIANAATYESVTGLRRQTSSPARLLGNETALERFAATGHRGGDDSPVTVAVATARHWGEFVSVIESIPRT